MNETKRSSIPLPVVGLLAVLVVLAVAFAIYFARDPKPATPASTTAAAPAEPVEERTPAPDRATERAAKPKADAPASASDAEAAAPAESHTGRVKLRFVMAGTREPVASARVTLVAVSHPARVVANGVTRLAHVDDEGGGVGVVVAHGTTAGDGSLEIGDLPDTAVTARLDDDFLFVTGQPVIAPSAETPEPTVLEVVRGGKIVGRVVTASGDPVVGASISSRVGLDFGWMSGADEGDEDEDAAPDFSRYAFGVSASTATTDASGAFALTGVAPKKGVVLEARHDDFAPGTSSPLDIAAGQEATASPIVLTPGGTLVVHVVGPDAKPVADAKVESSSPTPNDQFGSWGNDGSGADVDASGTVTLTHQPIGTRSLTVRSPTHPSTTVNDVEISLGQTTERTVTLTEGATITGTVVAEGGAGVAGAHGAFWSQDGMQREFQSDSEGRFRLEGLGRAGLNGQVSATGYVTAERVKLTPGATDARVVLKRGASISGRVVTAAGDPVTSYTITTLVSSGAAALFGMGQMPRGSQKIEDPEGRFTLPALADGDYSLRAHGEAGTGESAKLTIADAQSIDGVVVTVAPNLLVRGRVLDAATRAPVSGANVSSTFLAPSPMAKQFLFGGGQSGEEKSVRSDADGTFVLGEVPAQARAILAAKRGYLMARIEPLPQPGSDGACDVEIALSHGATIHGIVRDAGGAPVSGGGVVARTGFMPAGMSKTKADGAYSIGGLEAGTYSIGVALDEEQEGFGALRDTVDVTLADGETKRVDLGGSAPSGCRVHGKVLIDDHATPNVQVTLLDLSSKNIAMIASQRSTRTNDAGEFEIASVAPGRYTLGGETEGATLFASVTVADETDLRVDLVAPRGSLVVRVVDAKNGEPIESMEVVVMPVKPAGTRSSLMDLVSGGVWQQTTKDDGRCEFSHLAANRYEISAGNQSFDPTGGDATYATKRAEVSVAEGAPASIEVRLSPGVALEGKVVGPDGHPVAHPSVSLEDEAGRSASGLMTMPGGEDGHYRLSGLEPGVYVARVSAVGFAPLERGGVRVGSGTSHADFTLALGGSASVLVVDKSSHEPLGGASIDFVDAAGRSTSDGIDFMQMLAGASSSSTQTDSSGRLVREHLAAGTYTVKASLGAREASGTVTIREGAAADVRLELP